jgi:hypothetical protein
VLDALPWRVPSVLELMAVVRIEGAVRIPSRGGNGGAEVSIDAGDLAVAFPNRCTVST